MTERGKPDLSTIEPIGPVADVDEARTEPEAGPIAQVDAGVSGARPDVEPRTSPETEEQLDQLRRS